MYTSTTFAYLRACGIHYVDNRKMAYIDITHPFSSPVNRRIGNCLIFLGLLLWIWLPYSYWQQKQFAVGAIIVTGRIIQNDGAPLVTFRTASGDTVTVKLIGWRPGDLKKGDEIEVAYSPKNPQRLEEESSIWTGQWVIAIFALVSTAIGLLTRKGLAVWGPLKQGRKSYKVRP